MIKKAEAVTDLFKVHATVMVRVAELNPAAYNPRKISPEKFDALKESIRHDGFLEPMVVQREGMRIIGGHQRLKAVREICIEAAKAAPDLPCVVLDVDDKVAKKINIKLNKINGDFEARLLGELLVDIFDQDETTVPVQEFPLLGFDPQEAERYIRLIEPGRVPLPSVVGEPGSFGKSVTLSIEFDSVALRDKVKTLLTENGKTTKQKSGQLVAIALGLLKKRPARKSVA